MRTGKLTLMFHTTNIKAHSSHSRPINIAIAFFLKIHLNVIFREDGEGYDGGNKHPWNFGHFLRGCTA